MNRERGMALIVVLWVILIVSILSFSLASAVRAEMAASQNSFDSERAFFMAKGAADTVFQSLVNKRDLTQGSPIRMDKDEYIFPFDTGEVRVRFESDGGKIDLNAAPDTLLASMFDALLVDREMRNRLVESILDWRDIDDIPHIYGAEVSDYQQNTSEELSTSLPRNAPFASIDELLLVKNMTPEIFYGKIVADSGAARYRRIPGVRDLVTVVSGSARVNINIAAADVLSCMPLLSAEVAARIVAEREQKPFSGPDDLVSRIQELIDGEALEHLSFDEPKPTALISTATIHVSGVSRSVRMLYKQQQTMRYISFDPLLYLFVQEPRFDRWQFQ